MSKPITPEEAAEKAKTLIPDELFDIVNGLIADRFNGKQSIVRYKEVVSELSKRIGKSESHIESVGWLDFEPQYREAGWIVELNTPDRDEDYEGYWRFKK